MANYDFKSIEAKWQQYWSAHRTFAAEPISEKPKYYVLDMFPYPSGAGLHVGHPLGYIATDIVARYRWLKGYNVLHPMGYDAFGLPAEQYALDTGQHPATTTDQNIQHFIEQLGRIGLAHDPDSQSLRTCNPEYYRWTQWIFLQIFHSWYNLDTDCAEPIQTLLDLFAASGTSGVNAHTDFEGNFTAEEWLGFSDERQHEILLDFRLAYNSFAEVNWCPELGTVLANDEVVNGVSERGGFPVIRKPMRQWAFRMRAYADRLLEGLERIDWPEPIKEQQRNWIGRSEGANFSFEIDGHEGGIEVFSTRPDTIFGATFMVLAPEHPLLDEIVTDDRREEVAAYVEWAKNRTEVERQQEKKITGKFTGAYVVHPFIEEKKIPIWTADYVLWGYGTGAIMSVPAGDERDYAFAKHFDIEIIPIIEGADISEEAYTQKSGKFINSDFLNGMDISEAIPAAIRALEKHGLGTGTVNFRLRDPNFSRQRYWGEPFPIVYKNGLPYPLEEADLPLELPEVESYQPGGDGEGPLANLSDWVNLPDGSRRETNTMPGYAGSSWYFLRYFDVFNQERFADADKEAYWMNVDLYVGGSEHAVGHLMYSRFWTKVLYDLGHVSMDEPFGKLVNQGMLQGRSLLVYRVSGTNTFVSKGLLDQYAEVDPIHVPVQFGDAQDVLDVEAFRNWREEYKGAELLLEQDGKYYCGTQVEKMSKRYHNVVNPDEVCDSYGADTLRLYEMFLGPLEDHKPWSMQGIEGASRFLRKVWSLFVDEDGTVALSEDAPNKDELRILHQTIGKVESDIEALSLNTSVAQFMIFMNEIQKLNCTKRAILEPFLIILAPFAPHLCEEIWEKMGHSGSIAKVAWPAYVEAHTKVSAITYPVQINGKVRAKVEVAADLSKEAIQAEVLANEEVKALIGDKPLRKVIVVPGRIVNLVL